MALSREEESGFQINCFQEATFSVGSLSRRTVSGCLAGPLPSCCRPVQVHKPRFISLRNNAIYHVPARHPESSCCSELCQRHPGAGGNAGKRG